MREGKRSCCCGAGMTLPQRALNAALLAAMKAITIALPYSTTKDMRCALSASSACTLKLPENTSIWCAALLTLTSNITRPNHCCHPVNRRAVNTTWRNTNLPQPSRHRTVLTISGADVGVELPRPLPPFVRYVGPVLAEPPRPLPQDLADFVAGGFSCV